MVVALLGVFFSAYSQRRYDKSLNKTYGVQKHRPAKFRTNKKAAVICPTFIPSEYPYQGIGIKIGDPFVITYKLYATEMFALSIDGGLAAHGLYKKRYTDLFNTLPNVDSLTYINHEVKQDTHLSAKLSIYNFGPKIAEKLDYYVTLGWQFRYVQILYGYNESVGIIEEEYKTTTETLDYNGPEAGFGVEYAYFDLPLSAFIEVNWMYDMTHPDPMSIRFQGGIGIRYIF
jgi:hypothetical protein